MHSKLYFISITILLGFATVYTPNLYSNQDNQLSEEEKTMLFMEWNQSEFLDIVTDTNNSGSLKSCITEPIASKYDLSLLEKLLIDKAVKINAACANKTFKLLSSYTSIDILAVHRGLIYQFGSDKDIRDSQMLKPDLWATPDLNQYYRGLNGIKKHPLGRFRRDPTIKTPKISFHNHPEDPTRKYYNDFSEEALVFLKSLYDEIDKYSYIDLANTIIKYNSENGLSRRYVARPVSRYTRPYYLAHSVHYNKDVNKYILGINSEKKHLEKPQFEVLDKFFIKLIELGASYTVEENNGISWFNNIVRQNNINLIKFVISKGIDLNSQDSKGRTSLHLAYPTSVFELSEERKKLINLLLENGANPSIVDMTGKTANQSYTEGRKSYLSKKALAKIKFAKRAAQEEREIKIARLEAEKRKEEAERRRLVEAERQRVIAAQKRKEKAGGFDWAKAAAMGVGFLAGGGGKLDSPAQVEALTGIIMDSQEGVEGVSNYTGALNSTTQRYNAQNVKAKAARTQQKSANAIRNAKDHYFVLAGKSNLRSCGLPDAQTESFCKLANLYYEKYINAVKQDHPDQVKLYAIHKKTAREMLALIKTTPRSVFPSGNNEETKKILIPKNVPSRPLDKCESDTPCVLPQ
jgi:hypothetical protein